MADEALQEVKERLVRIEVLLENMSGANDLKLATIDERIKVANNRISDLEDTIKWIWRAISGALISAIIALLINFK